MMFGALAMTALNYVFDNQYEAMDMIKFVDAGSDQTFEQDELYSGYIKSAKLQKELMTQQNRQGHKTWTLKHYQEFQERRLRVLLADDAQKKANKAKFDKMNAGDKGWNEDLTDFSTIPEPTKNANGNFKFRGEEYSNYTR